MTNLAYGTEWYGIIPSAGGCDEFIKLLVYREKMKRNDFDKLSTDIGAMTQSANVRVEFVPLSEAWRVCPDAKMLSALTLYHQLLLTSAIRE